MEDEIADERDDHDGPGVTGRRGERPPARRRRGRPATPPGESRRRLIDAAERCFERAPVHDVGIADIVAEAGMSSRSFYQVFEGKLDVAAALAEARAADHMTLIDEVVGRAANPRDLVEGLMTFMMDRVPIVVGELGDEPGDVGVRIRAVRDRYRTKLIVAIQQKLQDQREKGRPIPTANPLAMMLVLAGLDMIAMRHHRERRRDDLRALKPALVDALFKLFPRQL